MCLCLIEIFGDCLRDASYSHLGIIGHLLVNNQEWSPYGRKQTIAVLLWNVFSIWISKFRFLPYPYRILYFQLVYQHKNEGQHCALCSLQFREREGMSQWEPVLCLFQLLQELLSLRYIGFIHSKAVVSQAIWASSSVGYFWKKSVFLHFSLCQHLRWRGCSRNEIMLINRTWYKERKKKKKKSFVALQP